MEVPMPHAPIPVLASVAARPVLEPLVADLAAQNAITLSWFATLDEALMLAPDAEVAWLEPSPLDQRRQIATAATGLKWLSSMAAGLETLPLALLRQRGVIVTNGNGLNSPTVADYAVMGVLSLAKGLPDVVRAHDRREWLTVSPGTAELEGSRALVIGYGTIGQSIARRLRAFDVEVTGVRRTADPAQKVLGPEDWRSRLGEYDWIVIAAPATDATHHLIGATELGAMKPTAGIVNIARGQLIDQSALIAALRDRKSVV
jgi:phosphoglycerate dehydrogenase-like enzyme